MSATRVLLIAGLAGLAGLATGCERAPVDAICPAELMPGSLVITEIRGDQTGTTDTLGQWIELYNGSGATVDLIGLHVRQRKVDGSALDRIIIRRSLEVAADDYVVIGLGDDAARPDYIDYAVGTDVAGTSLFTPGAIDLDLCDYVGGDQLIYDALPGTGTYSLGLTPPTTDGNDVKTSWCTNNFSPADSSGTPGAANPPCP